MFVQFGRNIKQEPATLVAIYACMTSKITIIISSTFVALVVQYNYMNDHTIPDPVERANKAKSLMGLLYLIGNVLSVPSAFLFGYLSDRFVIWPQLLANIIIACVSLFLFIYSMDTINLILIISFEGLYIANSNIFLLSVVLLSKVAHPENRGMLFGAYALIGSIALAAFNGFAGILFDKEDGHWWPFGIDLGIFAVYLLMCGGLGIAGKLR